MIELLDVVKEFPRPWTRPGPPVRALDGVSLDVQEGEALGIVGLNGAGKSTLLRVLLGYARLTSGEARIRGKEPRDYVERRGVAYVPERVTIPRGWTVRGALRAYAMMGDAGPDPWERVESALDRLGLRPIADRRIAALSKGNVQRVGIAQALLGDRQLMVLDEPTDGLDPIWIIELRAIVAEWRSGGSGRTLILASHNLPEVERLTDRSFLLHNGRIEGELRPSRPGDLEELFLARVGQLAEARP